MPPLWLPVPLGLWAARWARMPARSYSAYMTPEDTGISLPRAGSWPSSTASLCARILFCTGPRLSAPLGAKTAAAPARVSAANAATGTKRITLLMPPLPDGRLRPQAGGMDWQENIEPVDSLPGRVRHTGPCHACSRAHRRVFGRHRPRSRLYHLHRRLRKGRQADAKDRALQAREGSRRSL